MTRATTTNKTTPVTKPASLRAAGTPIMPAPTMELITLKEAPRIPLSFSFLALLVLAVPEDEGEAPSYRYIRIKIEETIHEGKVPSYNYCTQWNHSIEDIFGPEIYVHIKEVSSV